MKAEVAQQRLLLQLAEVDAELSRLGYQATHLPEQQRYEEVQAEERAAADRLSVLGIALQDLDAQVARLESEVDAVRRREDRDRGLMDGGTVQAKQLEELQHELATLERRQAGLEDSLLEVMERREELAADQAVEQANVDSLADRMATARAERDEGLAGIEQTRTDRAARRAGLIAEMDGGLVELYEKQRGSAGIGAARLEGGRCGACRIELDRGEVARILAAPEDEVQRCSECRAILLRSNGIAQ